MDKQLRKGWTTGACAAGAARAAATALLTGIFPDPVTVTLPGGLAPAFALSRTALVPGRATAGVIKDAGDDPDVTHGAEIVVSVARAAAAGAGITFLAGEGVGTVTLPGLPLAVGEPAINPGPRAQITANLADLAEDQGEPCDFVVTVAVPGGDALARRTLNPRLGIRGGLSILGTTGVVVPYSCAAWVHSIHRGIDVARALGLEHLAGATGSTSEAAVQRLFDLPQSALIDMGGFVGALLKYLRSHPVPRVTIAGGFAKMTKLAGGAMDLHSGQGGVDMAGLAAMLRELGADDITAAAARRARSAAQVLLLAGDRPLADLVARRARESCQAVLSGGTAIDVLVIDRAGNPIAYAGG